MTIEKFAGFVEMQRKVKRCTQEELTKNYSLNNAVSNWERRLSYPDITNLQMLAEEFGESIIELLGIKNELFKEPTSLKRKR